jgi:uncharacterized protein (DUF362 family)
MEKVKVAIVKTEDPYGRIRTVLDMLSPHGLRFKNARILVKPNICSPFPPEQVAANTHPDVIGACVRYLKEEGAHTVWVGDEPVWGLRSRLAYQKSGVKAVVEKEGGRLVYFDEDKRVKKNIPGGRIYDSLSVPAILDEIDLLINLPKMKINMMALVSLCFKNLLGLASFRDRKRFHRGTDISYALVDIAKLVKPSLNIIDGIQAMEGMSAHSGSVRSLGLLVGSLDMVAADIVGSRIMGFNPLEVVTTQLALKDKLGVEDPKCIEIVGEPIENVCTQFERPFPRLVHPNPNVEVIPGGICPGCTGRILKIPPHIDPGKRYGIIIGKRVSYPKHQEFDELWCFGDCGIEEGKKLAKRYPRLKEKMKNVKGCPPLEWWAKQTLEEELKERGWWDKDAMGR